jgi:hypothetical protein
MAHCVALHAHHEASLPIEFLDESYASRLETINTIKAREEEPWQIELRKKLFCEILPADMPTWLADLWKQSADLLKQSAYLWKQSADLLKQSDDLWKQRADLLKQRDDLWKQSDDLLKQSDDLWKQRADLLKQSDDLWKQRAEKLIAFHDSICHCGWTRTNNNIFNLPR